MKTNLRSIATVVLLSSVSYLHAQKTIQSTVNGGLWPQNDTWIESVPSDADSVVLQGPISMLSYIGWCKSLNITSTGSLGGNGNQGTLNINGSLFNNGAILGSINYVLTGNIVNNQPWTGVDNHLLFKGMNHSISCAPGGSINAQLQATDSLHNFTLLSDVTLNATFSSDLGFSQLNAGKHKLHISSGGFSNCRINSLDTLQFDAWVSNLNLTGDYKLTGNMICYNNIVFYDRAINSGYIQFASGISGDPLKLKGNFINEGTMNHAWVQVEKNITNHGIWNSFTTEFVGSEDKHISQSAGHPFGAGEKFSSDNSGSQIFLDTDIELTVPIFHLNNNRLNCENHILTANTTFFDGTISSESEIKGNNDFWNSTIKGNIILSGNNRFSNCTVDGTLENIGMMKDITFYGGTFKSYQHLLNRNSIQSLNLKIYGNLTNYGAINNNSIVDVVGGSAQYINMTQPIESQVNFHSNITGVTYQWMKDGNDLLNQVYSNLNFGSLQLSDAGIYKCRVATESGERLYSREIIVDNITSIHELELPVCNFTVFPNPITDHAVLSWEQKSDEMIRIDLIDLNGILVKRLANLSYPAGRNEFRIDTDSKLKSGQYLVRLICNGKTKTAKLIYTR